MRISVLVSDITEIRADAMVTAINSGGMWFGGIDAAITRVAGTQFHVQARDALCKGEVKVVVAHAGSDHSQINNGAFENVVFTIDDRGERLQAVVGRGLAAASAQGFHRVTMPMIRFGVMADVGENAQSKVEDIAAAVFGQAADPLNTIEFLTIVVFGDIRLAQQMRDAL